MAMNRYKAEFQYDLYDGDGDPLQCHARVTIEANDRAEARFKIRSAIQRVFDEANTAPGACLCIHLIGGRCQYRHCPVKHMEPAVGYVNKAGEPVLGDRPSVEFTSGDPYARTSPGKIEFAGATDLNDRLRSLAKDEVQHLVLNTMTTAEMVSHVASLLRLVYSEGHSSVPSPREEIARVLGNVISAYDRAAGELAMVRDPNQADKVHVDEARRLLKLVLP